MLKNIVFDMGQVLLRWTPERLMEREGVPQEDWETLKKGMFCTPEWVLADWGYMDVDGMYEYAKAHLPERLHSYAYHFIFEWFYEMERMPGMQELLHDLKEEGYRLYLLSNATARLEEHLFRIPGFEYMDGYVVSGVEKLLKPEVAIFHCLCARYGLKASESLFVDDLVTNCAGAQAAGMKSFVFKENAEELRAFIKVLAKEME